MMMTPRKKRKKRFECFGRLRLNVPMFRLCMWPGLISVIGLLLPHVTGQGTPGAMTTSAFSSGVFCGTNPQRRCLSDASCSLLGRCECSGVRSGNGAFQCYPPNSVCTEVAGTPAILKSFRNTTAAINWPCRFRLSEFTTIRRAYGEKCKFQIFGANQFIGGLTALTELEIHVQIIRNSEILNGIGIRIDGKAKNNVYTYTERGRTEDFNEYPDADGSPDYLQTIADGSGSGDGEVVDDEENDDYEWGSLEDIDFEDGEKINYAIDKDNFATISVPTCSAAVKFRAPDLDNSKNGMTPGVSVTFSESFGPASFPNAETYLAETTKKDILRTGARKRNLSLQQEVLHQAMEHAAKQYSTTEGEECEDTSKTYRSYCKSDAQKAAALKSCSFFLENSELVSCLDPRSDSRSSNSLKAFKLCLWHSCQPSRNVCYLLKVRLNQSGCTSYIPPAISEMKCSA